MQDIFISSLRQPITSWQQAFPDCVLVKNMAELVSANSASGADGVRSDNRLGDGQPPIVFWLHINQASQVDPTQFDPTQFDLSQFDLSQTVSDIRQHFDTARIVVLDNAPNHDTSLTVLGLGVAGYAHAYSAPEVLAEIRAVVSHGGLWLGQQLLQHLIESTVKLTGNNPKQVDKLLKLLTKREREVSLQAAKGLSNKEIARTLNITERTVKAHLAASFERLKVKDRLQLALMLNKQEYPNAAQNAEMATLQKVG